MSITVKKVETRVKDEQGHVYTFETLAADYEKTNAATNSNPNDSTPELDDPGN